MPSIDVLLARIVRLFQDRLEIHPEHRSSRDTDRDTLAPCVRTNSLEAIEEWGKRRFSRR